MLFFIGFLVVFLFVVLILVFLMVEIIVVIIGKGNEKKRKKLLWMIGFLIFLVGIFCCLFYGVLSDVYIFGKMFFDMVDFIVSNVLMLLGVLLIFFFILFRILKCEFWEEMRNGLNVGKVFFYIWFYLFWFIVLLVIIIVFLNLIGILLF